MQGRYRCSILILLLVTSTTISSVNSYIGNIRGFQEVSDLEYNPDLNQIIAVGKPYPYNLMVWKITDNDFPIEYTYESAGFTSYSSISYFDNTLLAGNNDGRIDVFNFNSTWHESYNFTVYDFTEDLQLVNHSTYLISDQFKLAMFFEIGGINTATEIRPGFTYNDRIRKALFNPLTDEIIIRDYGNNVHSWGLDHTKTYNYTNEGDNAYNFAIDPNSQKIAIVDQGSIYITDKTGAVYFNHSLQGRVETFDLQFSPDSKHIALVNDIVFEIFNTESQNIIFDRRTFGVDSINTIEWINNTHILTGDRQGVTVWDINSGSSFVLDYEYGTFDEMSDLPIVIGVILGYILIVALILYVLTRSNKKKGALRKTRKRVSDKLYPEN